jgi:outer membrane receptor protein involved in Fe transport
MIKPQENHTFRVSYNRAYRSPSVINNHLNLPISEEINVRGIGALIGLPPQVIATLPNPYRLPINVVGNPDLDEQSMDSFELGYSAVIGRAVLSAAYYHNWIKNEILFSEDTTGRYTAQNPPATWPLPPQVIAVLPGGSLPGRFTYLNFGESTQQGIELGINTPINQYFDVFANYSWQDEPNPKDFALSELNLPPTNRINVGLGFNRSRYSGNVSVSYSDDAFWQDVLDARYSGTTDAYTLVNAGFGVKWNDRFTTSIKAINLTDDDLQQHVFGDITKRQIIGELRVNFAR